MRLVLSSMLLAMAALFTLALGVWLAVAAGLLVRRVVGREWELLAFFAGIAVITAIAAAFYRWQDVIMDMLGGFAAPLPETLYCQTCGTPSQLDSITCRACHGTRFAISKPGERATRWHVQVGMDVLGADRQPVGVVKRRRARDFLVARALQRDVYVPFSAIAGANAREVHLSVAADAVGQSGWTRPALLTRPR